MCVIKKDKGSPYLITKRRVPELIPVLGSQRTGDVSHKPGGRLPLLSTRPAVTPTTLKRASTSFAAWWTEARSVWTVCLRVLPNSIAAAVCTQALLRLSPAHYPLSSVYICVIYAHKLFFLAYCLQCMMSPVLYNVQLHTTHFFNILYLHGGCIVLFVLNFKTYFNLLW